MCPLIRSTLALTLMFAFAGSAHAQVVPAGMASAHYVFAAAETSDMTFDFTVDRDPGNAQGIFWAHQFWASGGEGGSLGLQTRGFVQGKEVGRMAVFSIWNALAVQPAPGTTGEIFEGRSVGFSLRRPYQFREGVTYRFHLHTGTLSWWTVTLTDMESGETVTLGSIQVPSGWGQLQPMTSNFTEVYRPVASCETVAAAKMRFGTPRANDGTLAATLRPYTPYEVYGTCAAHASVTVLNGEIVHSTGVAIGPPTLPAAPPFGVFDSPRDWDQVVGEVAVTGWALDDSQVSSVRIYRSPLPGEPPQANGLVFIGDATFVRGERSDVAAAYPAYPRKDEAGWGYMLLSNLLPNRGDGIFTLHAIATDDAGITTVLGEKTIWAHNANSARPFGTIDAPAPGQTVSGVMRNWGWALAPSPGTIPTGGATIGVYIDNVFVGRPVYGLNRADIAAAFPGYANTTAAVGYFDFDTRTVANGVHSISWVVEDNLGNVAGIGSRYFSVDNFESSPEHPAAGTWIGTITPSSPVRGDPAPFSVTFMSSGPNGPVWARYTVSGSTDRILTCATGRLAFSCSESGALWSFTIVGDTITGLRVNRSPVGSPPTSEVSARRQ